MFGYVWVEVRVWAEAAYARVWVEMVAYVLVRVWVRVYVLVCGFLV